MDQLSAISEDLTEIEGHIADNFRVLSNVFQKLKKIKDSNRQSRQLEELTEKMRECKRLTKEFDKEVKALENNFDRETNKMLNEKKQSMFKELNSYVALKKKHATNIDHKRIELFEGPNEGFGDEDQQMADAPDIAKPSAPAPASSSYSLESIFRQLSEMSTLQASRHKEVCFLIRNIDFRIQSMFKELNSYVALKKKHATNIDHKRIELSEGPNEGFGDEDQQMADAPDIARPSVLGPASFSYSLESISRQLSEISTLQASRHKEICTLIRNIDFRSRF